jgi:hypothetical protein
MSEAEEAVKVLYMARPGDVSPLYQDFGSALGAEFEVVRWAPGRPSAAQVRGVLAVGGRSPSTR